MPIRGRTLREAAHTFCDDINHVLARTITRTHLIVFGVPPRVQLAFRQAGQPIRARLTTRFGPMGLYLGQVCESVLVRGGHHELRTVEYKYTLTPHGAAEPLLRWEYIRIPPPRAQWCRHHLQGPVPVPLPGDPVPLNDLHLPTGYVSFEDILRFCIVDLGVRPLSRDWGRVLQESYDRFRKEFVT